jgi:hypothetical protein
MSYIVNQIDAIVTRHPRDFPVISITLFIGIIHFFLISLCSLCSLWLNHSNATVNDITTPSIVTPTQLIQELINNFP